LVHAGDWRRGRPLLQQVARLESIAVGCGAGSSADDSSSSGSADGDRLELLLLLSEGAPGPAGGAYSAPPASRVPAALAELALCFAHGVGSTAADRTVAPPGTVATPGATTTATATTLDNSTGGGVGRGLLSKSDAAFLAKTINAEAGALPPRAPAPAASQAQQAQPLAAMAPSGAGAGGGGGGGSRGDARRGMNQTSLGQRMKLRKTGAAFRLPYGAGAPGPLAFKPRDDAVQARAAVRATEHADAAGRKDDQSVAPLPVATLSLVRTLKRVLVVRSCASCASVHRRGHTWSYQSVWCRLTTVFSGGGGGGRPNNAGIGATLC